eukprot:6616288-Pyramimonas_sp.AAC.1
MSRTTTPTLMRLAFGILLQLLLSWSSSVGASTSSGAYSLHTLAASTTSTASTTATHTDDVLRRRQVHEHGQAENKAYDDGPRTSRRSLAAADDDDKTFAAALLPQHQQQVTAVDRHDRTHNRKLLVELSIDTVVSPRGWNML